MSVYHKIKPLLLFFILFCQLSLFASHLNNTIHQTSNNIILTDDELAYVKNNNTIKVHNEKNWAPFNFNHDGIPSGFSIDYIKLVASKVGLNIEFVTGEWNELLNLTMTKKNDVMLNIVYTEQRAKNLIYVDKYSENPNVIFARKNDSTISGIDSLFGKKVAVVAGFFNEDILIKDYPLVQRVVCKNMVEAIKAVQQKNADAVFAGVANINYVMKELLINDLEIKSEFDTGNIEDQKLYIATKKDDGVLASILKKGMSSISLQQITELKQKWQINSDNQSKLNLTNEQKNWLKANAPIKLGSTNNWPPFDMIENGKHTGINADYLSKLKEILGVEIVPVINHEWNGVLSDAKDGKSHGITGLPQANEYEKDFLFTQSYVSNPVVIITKSTSKIKNINDLKTLNTVNGNDFSAELSKEQNSKVKYFNSTIDCFNDVLDGKSDGYIGWLADAQYLMTQNAINGLKVSVYLPSNQSALKIGVSKQNPQLKEILDVALNQINQDEKNKILNKWISTSNDEHKLQLTISESKWIQSKPIIKFAVDPHWTPLEQINNDKKYEGMNADFLALVSEITGINFQLEQTKEWTQSVELSKENKIDMLACVSKTAEREKYLNFSNKTFELTDGILMRSDAKFIDKIDDLKGLKVGVPDGTSVHKKLQKENPLLILVPIKGSQLALEMLVKGEIDAYAGNLEVSGYLIQQLSFYNLKVIWRFEEKRDMHIALQKTLAPEALSVINKAISLISNEQIQTIRQRWIGLKVTDDTNYLLILKISVGIFFLILFIIYNNWRLKKMVANKTEEIGKLLSQFDKNIIASETNEEGIITYVSEAFCKISGFTKEELIGKNHSIVKHPDMPKEVFDDLWKTIKSGLVWKGEIKNQAKDGSFYWVESIITPKFLEKGISGYIAIRQDITAKKEVEEFKETLEIKVEERTNDLNDERNFVNSIMNTQDNFLVVTDGISLQLANNSMLNFYGVKNIEEFIANIGTCICDTFNPNSSDEFIKKMMNNQTWIEYIYENKNNLNKVLITKNGKDYTFTITADKFTFKNRTLSVAVFTDITELEETRKEVERILANILLPVLITSKKERTILYANKYAEYQYEKSTAEIIGSPIDDIYTITGQHHHIVEAIQKYGMIENMEESFKTSTGKEFDALLSITPITYQGEDAYIGMVTDITKQKKVEKEIRDLHKNTKDSIKYAALIQHSIIPSNDLFKKYFSEYLVIWHPKDIVGGDIYFFEELRNEDECLMFVIDCTGHGVPGAFVTMLVKAIERQIVSNILYSNEIVNPAKLLAIFNKSMKHLLKQENKNNISNAGFDGAILYYNKKDKVIKYAGANTPLFYLENEKLITLKGDKHSIGYKKSDAKFEFTEYIINTKEGMQFFLSTDGYLDQNGGDKGFPFGKKKFSEIIINNQNESFADIQEILLDSLMEYQKDEDRNDDVTVIGIKI